MTSFAQFRRNCFDGRKVNVDNRYRPEVSGERRIIHASTVGLTMTPPEGQDAKVWKTSLDWPKAVNTEISPDGLTCTIKFDPTDGRYARQMENKGTDIFLVLTLS